MACMRMEIGKSIRTNPKLCTSHAKSARIVKIRLRSGLRLTGFYCPFCDAKRDGRVYRELYEWYSFLACGHRKKLGYVLPFEELERRKIINAEDFNPAAESRKAQMIRDKIIENKELAYRAEVMKGLTRGKRYI